MSQPLSAAELDSRLKARPEMCQTWVAAVPLKHDGGVLYLSSISDGTERIGVVHIYIWDKSDMGSPEGVSEAVRKLFYQYGLDRIVAEIDVDNTLAINLAKRVGLHAVGVVRQRKNGRGGTHDVLLIDALPEDLQNGRCN